MTWGSSVFDCKAREIAPADCTASIHLWYQPDRSASARAKMRLSYNGDLAAFLSQSRLCHHAYLQERP
jgi:hypothetical protein